ncbi:MAG: NHL repeat-containing protein [Thiohalomonadales bacterium]
MNIIFKPTQFIIVLMLILISSQIIAKPKIKIKTKAVKHLFDITIANDMNLSLPSDVATLGEKIYIVDGDNHRILVFNESGKFLFSFGSKGNKDGQFFYPVGIFVANNGEIYVTDTKNYRIQKFTRLGRHILSFDSVSGKKKIKKVRPVDITVHEKTKEIFVTTKHHTIVVYNQSGKKIREWGGNGKQDSFFRYPGSIVNMSDNRVGVVDILNTRVQVFRNKGRFSFQVSKFGVQPGHLVRPKGIAIADDEKIYISDSYLDVIQVFTSSGKFQYVLGSNGKPYRFTSAAGISINKNKLLVVAEPFVNKVSVFKILKF